MPPYYNDKSRKDSLKALQIAGLPTIGLIDESEACGIYYASESKEIDGKNLVFNMGADAFYISIINIERKDGNIIANVDSTLGNNSLGG